MDFSAVLSRYFKKALVVVALFFMFPAASGCATGEPKLEDDMAALKAQVWSLQKQTAELGLKVSYNSDEIALLSERMKVLEESRQADVLPPETRQPPVVEDVGDKSDIGPPGEAPSDSMVVAQTGKAPEGLGPDFKDLKPEQMYKVAMDFFNNGDYDTAIEGFKYMVRRYPGSGLAPNAQYWMGEAFYSQKRYARAGEEFRKIIVRYPDSQKTPDALLKMGMCKLALDKKDEGQEILKKVIDEYPGSVAASTAKTLLEEAGSGVR